MLRERKREFLLISLMYILVVIFRGLLTLQDSVLSIYPDELSYLDPARSFIQAGNFAVHNINHNWEPILYVLFLAPFTFIKNSYLQIKIIKLFNCFLMCSSIFPVYFLSTKILNKRKHILVVCFLTAIIPEFAMTQYIMAENLFFPLSIWFFYLVYLFISETRIKQKNIYICLISFFCVALYICKSIALSYPIGFFFILIYETIFVDKWKSLKTNFVRALLFGGIYVFLLLAFKSYIASTADVLGNLYDDMVAKLLQISLKEIIFAGYCLLNYLVYTLVAFIYFPLVYTGIKMRNLRKENRELYIFSVISLFAMWCATILISNIHEDAMESAIRIHARYFSVILIPLLILFFRAAEEKSSLTNLQKRMFATVTFIVSVIMFFILRLPKYGCDLDNFLIFYYKVGIYKLCEYWKIDTYRSGLILYIMFIIILCISIGTYFLSSDKKREKTFNIIISFIVIVFMFDNMLIAYFSYENNERFNGNVAEAVKINDYFKDKDGKILVVVNENLSQDNTLDTYINKLHYTVKFEHLYDIFANNSGIWYIEGQAISANYPWHVYKDLNRVDYLVTRNDIEMNLDKTDLEEINLDGVFTYRVFRNNNPTKLKLSVLSLEDEAISIDFSEGGNSSSYIVSGFQGQERSGNWTSKEAVLEFEGQIISDFEIQVNGGKFIEENEIGFEFDGNMIADEDIKRTDSGYLLYIDEDYFNGNKIKHSLKMTDYKAVSPAMLSNEYSDTRIISFFVNEVIIRDIE